MLQLYQEILGLRFERDASLADGAWAPGIDAYQVYDAKTGARLGAFFLDLHPRDGKYGHAAMFPLQSPSLPLYGTAATGAKGAAKNGAATKQQQQQQQQQRLAGVGALVCNFPASTPTAPALLPHSDVVTLFHEFGHVMHQVLASTDLARFAGASSDCD
jgi:Zn-dependent oligopeptidase